MDAHRYEKGILVPPNNVVRMGEPPTLLALFKNSQQTRPTHSIRQDLVVSPVTSSLDPHNVSIRPLSVHQLYAAAARASKEINFARPLMKGLVVCMRKTRNSPHIPIYSMQELDALVLKHKPPLPPPQHSPNQMQIP